MTWPGSPSDLLQQLSELTKLPPTEFRSGLACALLGRGAVGSQFADAVNFAREQELITTEIARQLRGEPIVAPVLKYWSHPLDGSQFAWIPAGKFYFGEANHEGHLEGFFLARHPVTQAQFQVFLAETDYQPAADDPLRAFFLKNWVQRRPSPGQENHPVTWVSLRDAQAYCAWAQLQLPTERHWEKAARGVDGRTFPWGDQLPITEEWQSRKRVVVRKGHVQETSTCEVTAYSHVRSPYGCEQMVGNVSEWCQPAQDETPAAQFAPVRGACFRRRGLSRMPSWHQRQLSVDRRNNWCGFRPALISQQ